MVEHKFNKHDIFSLQEWSSQYKTFTNETRDHLNCVSSVSGLTISAMQTTPLFFVCSQIPVIRFLSFPVFAFCATPVFLGLHVAGSEMG